jgi:hypothetical protein
LNFSLDAMPDTTSRRLFVLHLGHFPYTVFLGNETHYNK